MGNASVGERLSTDMRVVGARLSITTQDFRVPLTLSSGPITQISLAHAEVEVEGANGARAVGRGEMYLSDLWAWPSKQLDHPARNRAMVAICQGLADNLPAILDMPGHPVELGCLLHGVLASISASIADEMALPEPIPSLAAGVCASPFDAALHDAYGLLHGRSSYDLLGPDFLPADLSHLLGDDIFQGATVEAALSGTVLPRVPGCVLVSCHDPLTPEQVISPVGDGLPECAADWMRRYGFRFLKLKPSAKDPREDAAWVSEAFHVLRDVHAGAADLRLSYDPNEGYASVDVLVEFLDALEALDPAAYRALAYIEQPIPRAQSTAMDLRPASTRKPILADEGITWVTSLRELTDAGWSGFAMKTCKLHTFCLLQAAWCHLTNHPYSLQDLTNPSLSALHALGLAARLRTINGIELNTMQYTPRANDAVLPHHPGAFQPVNGEHDASTVTGTGLGYGCVP